MQKLKLAQVVLKYEDHEYKYNKCNNNLELKFLYAILKYYFNEDLESLSNYVKLTELKDFSTLITFTYYRHQYEIETRFTYNNQLIIESEKFLVGDKIMISPLLNSKINISYIDANVKLADVNVSLLNMREIDQRIEHLRQLKSRKNNEAVFELKIVNESVRLVSELELKLLYGEALINLMITMAKSLEVIKDAGYLIVDSMLDTESLVKVQALFDASYAHLIY